MGLPVRRVFRINQESVGGGGGWKGHRGITPPTFLAGDLCFQLLAMISFCMKSFNSIFLFFLTRVAIYRMFLVVNPARKCWDHVTKPLKVVQGQTKHELPFTDIESQQTHIPTLSILPCKLAHVSTGIC